MPRGRYGLVNIITTLFSAGSRTLTGIIPEREEPLPTYVLLPNGSVDSVRVDSSAEVAKGLPSRNDPPNPEFVEDAPAAREIKMRLHDSRPRRCYLEDTQAIVDEFS